MELSLLQEMQELIQPKGNGVAFLDPDDWWDPDKLNACLIQNNERPNMALNGITPMMKLAVA